MSELDEAEKGGGRGKDRAIYARRREAPSSWRSASPMVKNVSKSTSYGRSERSYNKNRNYKIHKVNIQIDMQTYSQTLFINKIK